MASRDKTLANELREALRKSLHQLKLEEYLVWLAQKEPELYTKLLVRALPNEIDATVQSSLEDLVVQSAQQRGAEAAGAAPAAPVEHALEKPTQGDVL